MESDVQTTQQPPAPPDAIGQIVGEKLAAAVKPMLDQVTALAAEVQKATASKSPPAVDGTQAREQYAAAKMADLPLAYRRQLGADPAGWAAEEQAIRAQYQADFRAAGGKTPVVDGGVAGGSPPSAVVDLSKLNPLQKIEMGIRNQRTTA